MSPTAPNSRLRSDRANFLSLPAELRHAIYDLALPIRHLSTTHFIDGEHDPEPQPIPPLFFTNRQIYSEAAHVFYANATLCVPVPQLSSHLQDWATGKKTLERTPAMTRHMSLSFLPQRFKDTLRRASLFNNEAGCYPTPIAYEALLCWLARNTGVTSISISKALMFRACKRRLLREEEEAALLASAVARPPARDSVKAIKIFSRNDREFWEGRGMGAGRGTIVAEQAPSLRMFVCVRDSASTGLICDPRGTPRANRQNTSDVERAYGGTVGEMMDALRSGDSTLDDAVVQQTSSDGRWLFQVIFVI